MSTKGDKSVSRSVKYYCVFILLSFSFAKGNRLFSIDFLAGKMSELTSDNLIFFQTLVKRHQDFVMLYNAQCDSPTPMTGI